MFQMSKHPWALEFEEGAEEPVKGDGKQFYMFVIGGGDGAINKKGFLRKGTLIPQTYRRDDNGKRVKSKFGVKDCPYQLTDLLPPEFTGGDCPNTTNTTVVSWKTPASVLQSLSPGDKAAINHLKRWINNTQCAFWWHDGNSDLCSRYGGIHLHGIVQSSEIAPGIYQRANAGRTITDLRKHIKNINGYFDSQSVRDVKAAILYFNKQPRVFLGSRSELLRRVREAVCQFGALEPIPTTGTCGDNFGGSDVEDGADVRETIGDEGDDSESDMDGHNKYNDTIDQILGRTPASSSLSKLYTEISKPTSRGVPSYDLPRLDRCDESIPVLAPAPKKPKLDVNIKETANDKFVPQLKKIIEEARKYDAEGLMRWIDEHDNDDYKRFILHLSRNNKLENTLTTAVKELRISSHKKSFMDMAEEALTDPTFNKVEEFKTLPESFYLMFSWIEAQWKKVRSFIESLRSVVDKDTHKINCFLIVGQASTGKSYFIQRPLQKLQPFRTLVSGVGNASQFQWEKCVGQRIIFVDECKMSPENMEMAKYVFGGEEPEVNRKHKEQAPLYKAPVIACGNDDPWLLAFNQNDKEAMRSRCIRYESRVIRGVPQMKADINPRVWFYFLKALDLFRTDEDYNIGNIYEAFPELDYCEVSSDDELPPSGVVSSE